MKYNDKFKIEEKVVAIYIRVSTKEQAEEGFRLEAQEKICREKYEKEGGDIRKIKVYADEGVSGKNIKSRVGMRKMLEDIREGKIEKIYVWKESRLARNLKDLLEILEVIIENEVNLETIDGKLDINTSAGRMCMSIMGAVAEYERETIVEQVNFGMKERARQGQWNGGVVLGYDSQEVDGKTYLVVNKEEKEIVRKIYTLYLEGKGFRTIAEILNTQGYRTKGTKNKKGVMFSGYAIKYILSNSIYIGRVTYSKRKKGRIVECNEFDGIHEPIIEKEKWEQVQEMIKAKAKKPSRVSNGSALLTGLMKCPECGASLVIGTSAYTNKKNEKTKYRFYKCSRKTTKGNSACGFKHIVKGEETERIVLERLSALASSPKIVEDVIEKLNKESKEHIEPLVKEKKTLLKQLEREKERKDKLFELYMDGNIDKASIAEKLSEMDKMIEDKKKQIEELEKELLGREKCEEIDAGKVQQLLKKIIQRLDKADNTTKKQVINLLVEKIVINKESKVERIQLKMSNDMLKELGVSIDALNLFKLEL